MIKITCYTHDETLNENTKKTLVNVMKTGRVEDDIEIQLLTGEKKKILWNLYNEISGASAINLYIIDLEVNRKEGIVLAKEIRKKDALCYIVFVSNGNCPACEVLDYRIKATAFFFKPIGTYEFVDLINGINYDRAQLSKARKQSMAGHIFVNSEYKRKMICISDINYVEFAKPKSIIQTIYGPIEVNMKMHELYSLLRKEDLLGTIIRPHQSFIVNLSYAETFDYKNLEVTMKKGRVIPVSRERKKDVKEAFDTTLKNNLCWSLTEEN